MAVLHPGDHGRIALRGAGSAAQPSSTAPTTAPATPQSGQQQATTIQGYLTQSAAARSGVSDAISSIAGCRNIPASITTLSNAADARTKILTSLDGAQVSALPGGAALLTDLQHALQASATADHDYAAWGSAVAAACVGQAAHTADYTAATQSDTVATAAKQSFVTKWNPVAAQFGLPAQSASVF